MARLILLNGAPGVGKSTIARRWADEQELALVLDVDLVRALLSAVTGDVSASWLAARALALAMARTHLLAGHDVIVPQYLGRPEFVEQLAAVAAATPAAFLEVVLTTDAATGRERFDGRGDVPQLVGADETWEQMHLRLQRLLDGRPHAVRVDAGGGVEQTYVATRAVLAVPRVPG